MPLPRRAALLFSLAIALHAQSDFYLKDGDTVVFYGDSITDQRLYTTFAEVGVLTRFPRLHVRFVHSGWAGDRVSGGIGGSINVRLKRDVIAYQPSVLTIMLGMNDGGYVPYDPVTFVTFASGYEGIVKTVRKALPNVRITAIRPSPYDDVTRSPEFEGGYNGVLARYGEYLRDLAQRENLNLADLNTSVVAALRSANDKDRALARKIIPDRVHPAAAGHMLLAGALLKSWDTPAIVTAVEIDAAAVAVTRSENTTVTELSIKDGISWMQADRALPMPVDWTDPVMDLAVRSSDFMSAIDHQPLRVKGLSQGGYTLTIDADSAGTFTGGQLAAGINLAELTTPMAKQAAEVLMLTYYHNNLHFARRRMVDVPLAKYELENTRAAMDTLDVLETEVVAAQHAAAQPKPHHYRIQPISVGPRFRPARTIQPASLDVRHPN